MKEKWDDITIGDYQELCSIESEGVQRTVDIVSLLTDKDSDEIRRLPLGEFFDYQKRIGFISTSPDAYVLDTFELDGVEYGRIPDLDFIRTDEWMDIVTWKDKSIDNMHLITAVLFRPITKKSDDGSYEIEEHKQEGFMKRADKFKNELSISKVYGTQVFFSLFALEFLVSIQDYSTPPPQKKETMKKTSRKKATQKHTRKNK